jgi:PAS domain S-box-containing protein
MQKDEPRKKEPPSRAPASVEKAMVERRLSDQGTAGFFALDRQGRIREVNDIGAKMLGFRGSWLVGRAFVVFVARQDVQRFLDLLVESTRVPKTHMIQIDLYLGARTTPVEVSLVAAAGTLTYQLAVIDLTQARDSEQALQSLSNWYSLLHNAPDTILTVDFRGRIHFVNKPTWGYSVSALVGTNILDYVPQTEHPKVLRCLSQAFRFHKRSMCDIASFDAHSSRWFNFSFGIPHWSSVADSVTSATTIATTLVIREVSELKRTEQTLRESGEQLREFAAHVDAVREEERTRVAREIHDELGQALTALKLDLSWLQKKSGPAAGTRKKVKQMMADVDNTIQSVRRISSELRPSVLDDLGLIPAIEWLLAQFRKRTRIRTELICKEETLHIASNVAAAVFRVVQEALTNVIRHAEASQVAVRLWQLGDTVRISIADNGRGMTKKQSTNLKALGIVGMKERILRFGGDFKLSSEPGRGTRIEISIPREP